MEHADFIGGSSGGSDGSTREVRPPNLEVDDKMEERVFFDEMIEESDDTEKFQEMYQDKIEQEAVNSEDLGEQEFQAMFDGNNFSHQVDEVYRIDDIENIAIVDFLNIVRFLAYAERWHVALFVESHNHDCLDSRLVGFLPTHRKMAEFDTSQLNNMKDAGIST
ncbi:FAR1 DNA-binding domain protein [Arachis hypogaea]|uniref:Uncharacterized protein n=1 Tax=Arachis hypogaea TaxID=3818 RepID=A0A444YZ30_ARAHY|nr:FAR1 DNA-binding domain protein [Arachis hypogaea]RYR07192.1 hypothetical protein Ahy_B05g074507 [Arachis hypogaea]